MMSTMEDAVLAAAPCLISAGHLEILGEAVFKKAREKSSGSDLLFKRRWQGSTTKQTEVRRQHNKFVRMASWDLNIFVNNDKSHNIYKQDMNFRKEISLQGKIAVT